MKRIIYSFILALFISFLFVDFIGKPLEREIIKSYQLITKKKPQHITFDSTGVPMVFYEGKTGKQYNTVTISQYIIDNFDLASNDKIIACLNWLRNNYENINDSSIIYYSYFDWPSYKMKNPWRSAMNQGRAMQAFLKGYHYTNDSIYLKYAKMAMNTLFTEVKDGGVTYKDSLGYWYEEYADDGAIESRVLNGMIVVLEALSDYYKSTKDTAARYLFEKGNEQVMRSLHLYDNSGHSFYDQLGKPATTWYHNFHIELLDFLYNETSEKIYKQYSDKWSKYKEPGFIKNLIRKPTKTAIVTFLVLFMFLWLVIYILFTLKDNRSIKESIRNDTELPKKL